MTMKGFSFAGACVAAVLATGCTIHQTEAPPLAGPSEAALSVSMTASPDTLFADGVQQAVVTVFAHDAKGTPKANQQFHLTTSVDQATVPYGTLSSQTVVTGPDGRGSVTYTMPVFSPLHAGTASKQVAVVATPVGTNYVTALSSSVLLLVVPPPVPTALP